MAIKISEGDTSKQINLLNSFSLVENTTYLKIAYLKNITTGTTVDDKRFYRLKLKDLNGKLIVGRMFNLPIEKEEQLMKLQNSVVSINFTAQKLDDSMSLIINDIEQVPENIGLRAEDFYKTSTDLQEVIKELYETLTTGRKEDIFIKALKANKRLDKLAYASKDEVMGAYLEDAKKAVDLALALGDDSREAYCMGIQYLVAISFVETTSVVAKDILNSQYSKVLKSLGNLLDTVCKHESDEPWCKEFSSEITHMTECLMGLASPVTYNALTMTKIHSMVSELSTKKKLFNGLALHEVYEDKDLKLTKVIDYTNF